MNSKDIKTWRERRPSWETEDFFEQNPRIAAQAMLAEISDLRQALAKTETERDHWAAKWQAVRRELAQARYPGMTKTVRALSKEKP